MWKLGGEAGADGGATSGGGGDDGVGVGPAQAVRIRNMKPTAIKHFFTVASYRRQAKNGIG